MLFISLQPAATALMKVFRLVRNGDLDGLETFLSTSYLVDLNHENERTHLTPLMVACNRPNSNLEVINLLIEKGAEVDYQTDDHGYSALMKAVEIGNVEVVKCLIKHGAQVDLKDNRGKSALEVGCEKGNIVVVEGLLKVGAEGLSSGDVQYSVHSSFNTAVEHNHTKLVKWFLESVNITNIPVSALFFAIDNQSIEMIRLLLDHGAQANLQNERKVSALMLAVSKGNVEVVKELLEGGADVNLKGEGGSTALLSVLLAEDHDVPQQSKIAIVKVLLEHGANADVQDDKQRNPLKCAIKTKSAEIVKLLIDKIENLQHQLDKEKYILEKDVYSSPDVLKLLLDAGANPNITVISRTPLLTVDDVDLAKMLIDHGANVDQCDVFGDNPILRAVTKSDYKLVELLLENNADITLERESNGNSAKIILQRNPRQILVSPFYL